MPNPKVSVKHNDNNKINLLVITKMYINKSSTSEYPLCYVNGIYFPICYIKDIIWTMKRHDYIFFHIDIYTYCTSYILLGEK